MVSFTNEDQKTMEEKGYTADASGIGLVFYPEEGVEISENAAVNYEEYPWITCFRVEGIRPVKEGEEDPLQN